MRRVHVKLAGRKDISYDVFVKAGLFDGDVVKLLYKASTYAIISDSRVARIYGVKLIKKLSKNGLKCHIFAFPAGERSKSRSVKEKIEDKLFSVKFGRDGCIISLGGGVTGDLAGFVAATYMRGVPYVQIPTTLLAMVDASVGGKVAVDVPAGKNLVGAFYQPQAVFIDPKLLSTLPRRQIRAGLAEIVKHAVIADSRLFRLLEEKTAELLEADPKIMEPVIAANCEIKARVVSRDEREENLRQVLNYGHTIGHAVEKLTGYRMLHGEAVALGMAVEGDIACKLGIYPKSQLDRQNELLKRFGFKLKLPKGVRIEEILKTTQLDKKARSSRTRMAVPERIGKMHKTLDGNWSIETPDKIIRAALKNYI